MDKNNFEKSIKKSISLFREFSFLFQAGTDKSLIATDEFKKASREGIAYKELYDKGTKNQDYNLMLDDKSFFQFSINDKEELRLVYYPNPYNFTEFQDNKKIYDEMLQLGQISLEDYGQYLSEETFFNEIPLIRYDYAWSQHCEKYHPAAHFHIGFHSENRWPVKRIISPFAFILKILMIYYPNQWKEWGDKGHENNILDQKYQKELEDCKVIESQFFSENEEKRMYFK